MKNIKVLMIIILGLLLAQSVSIAAENGFCYVSPDYFFSDNEILKEFNLSEGESVRLNVSIEDLDQEGLTYKFSYPFKESGFWDIGYNESGIYISKLEVNDTQEIFNYFFKINVENTNRLPEIEVSDIIVEENETVYLDYSVYDADNDQIEIYFEPPFDENGTWETEIGDAGSYNLKITAYDGTDNVSENFTVTVNKKPLPPKINMAPTQELSEGENFTLRYSVDSERPYNTTFTGCMQDRTEYFGYDSPRECKVTLTVKEKLFEVEKETTLKIRDVNRLPQINSLTLNTDNQTYKIENNGRYNVFEGQNVSINLDAIDLDGDNVTYSAYPFGKQFKLGYNDSGFYQSQVLITDNRDNMTKRYLLIINDVNRPPEIVINDTFRTIEGENFTLQPVVYDKDKDQIEISYDGWMNESTRYVDYNQAGTHYVNITADDSKDTTEKEVKVIVENKNRKPVVKRITVEILSE